MLSDIDTGLLLLYAALIIIGLIITIKMIIWTRDTAYGIKDLNKKFDLILKKMGIEAENPDGK